MNPTIDLDEERHLLKQEHRTARRVPLKPERQSLSPDLWPGDLEWKEPAEDSRKIQAGDIIPGGHYADQPYIVKTKDNAWLCIVTTGSGEEGSYGQHIVALRSSDCGRTWSKPVSIEPPDGPEASWGVPLAASGGRIFVFYTYNAENHRELPSDSPYDNGKTRRMDSHGHYVFRWSDDHGLSWSAERVTLPVREFEIDRRNSTGGAVRLFWNVGRPVVSGGSVLLTLHKVRSFGAGWFTESEGAFLRSSNLLSVENPAEACWETLPEGDHGLRTPHGGGPVAEEQSAIMLSDGSLFVVYRSIDGYPVGSYSRDFGRTWEEPQYLRYADGRLLKHPRAACFPWRLASGGYVLWFHNHGGRFVGEHPQHADLAYSDRNPAWLCRGHEVPTAHGPEVVWDNPEIVLYDDDPSIRMSYPDLVEEGSVIFLTETQKSVARVHRLSDRLTTALREGAKAFDAAAIAAEAVFLWEKEDSSPPEFLPALPPFLARLPQSPYGLSDLRGGFSMEIFLDASLLKENASLFNAWEAPFGGIRLGWEDGRLGVTFSDGRTECSWRSRALSDGAVYHLVVIVDGGPKIICLVVNGSLDDGGDELQFGWGRFSPHFRGLLAPFRIWIDVESQALQRFRLYPRALLTAEAEALFRGGRKAT